LKSLNGERGLPPAPEPQLLQPSRRQRQGRRSREGIFAYFSGPGQNLTGGRHGVQTSRNLMICPSKWPGILLKEKQGTVFSRFASDNSQNHGPVSIRLVFLTILSSLPFLSTARPSMDPSRTAESPARMAPARRFSGSICHSWPFLLTKCFSSA